MICGKANTMKLSKAQSELLAAMKAGVRVHYLNGAIAPAFREDTFRACTATILALKKRGLVEAYLDSFRGCLYRPVADDLQVGP